MSAGQVQKVLRDLKSGTDKLKILALMYVPRIKDPNSNSPEEIELLSQMILEATKSSNPDISFLARKAHNSLQSKLGQSSPPTPALPKPQVEIVLEIPSATTESTELDHLSWLQAIQSDDFSMDRMQECLQDKDNRIRATSVEVVSRVCDAPTQQQLLLPLLQDENNRVKGNAVVALGSINLDSVTEALAQMLSSTRISFRESAVWAIGSLPPSEILKGFLLKCLHDPYRDIRLRAVEGLERYPHADIILQMRRLQNDLDIEICKKSSEVLASIEKAQESIKRDNVHSLIDQADIDSQDLDEDQFLTIEETHTMEPFDLPAEPPSNIAKKEESDDDLDEFIDEDQFLHVDQDEHTTISIENDFLDLPVTPDPTPVSPIQSNESSPLPDFDLDDWEDDDQSSDEPYHNGDTQEEPAQVAEPSSIPAPREEVESKTIPTVVSDLKSEPQEPQLEKTDLDAEGIIDLFSEESETDSQSEMEFTGFADDFPDASSGREDSVDVFDSLPENDSSPFLPAGQVDEPMSSYEEGMEDDQPLDSGEIRLDSRENRLDSSENILDSQVGAAQSETSRDEIDETLLPFSALNQETTKDKEVETAQASSDQEVQNQHQEPTIQPAPTENTQATPVDPANQGVSPGIQIQLPGTTELQTAIEEDEGSSSLQLSQDLQDQPEVEDSRTNSIEQDPSLTPILKLARSIQMKDTISRLDLSQLIPPITIKPETQLDVFQLFQPETCEEVQFWIQESSNSKSTVTDRKTERYPVSTEQRRPQEASNSNELRSQINTVLQKLGQQIFIQCNEGHVEHEALNQIRSQIVQFQKKLQDFLSSPQGGDLRQNKLKLERKLKELYTQMGRQALQAFNQGKFEFPRAQEIQQRLQSMVEKLQN